MLLIMGSFIIQVNIILNIMLKVTLPSIVMMVGSWYCWGLLMIVSLKMLVIQLIMWISYSLFMMLSWNYMIL